MVLLLIHIYVMMTATFILMFFLFPADLLFGQNIAVNEVDIVGEIERRVTKLAEETLDTRRKNNKKRLEKILLRISSTGMLALSRNEIFAESLSIFQNDDVEEETGERSQFVPTVGLDESLFTVPSYYLVQVREKGGILVLTTYFYDVINYFPKVIGRALAGAGIVGSDVIQLKPLSVSCHTEDWSNVYQDYLATYHPGVASFASPGSLKYRLSQFLRRAKTELSCLGEDEELASLLEALQLILSEDITNTARGLLDVRSSEMEEAILDSYEAVESVIREREKDWRTILSLRLVLLLSKMVGWGLQTWGRNLDDWPADVGLLDVPTNYYVGIAGRALLYSMFVLDDFRS